jgi:two-component system sensor histidine kinase PilS (NtrC family)
MSVHFSESDLGEMVLRIAHGIRNPLATIKSGVQLIQHLTQPNEEIEEYFNAILSQVARIDFIVRDIQQFVQIDPLQPIDVDVSQIIEDLVAPFNQESPTHTVVITAKPSPTDKMLLDPGPFRMALIELIRNAIQFSHEEDPVQLQWGIDQQQTLIIDVIDQGPGVPPEFNDRILRPFFSTSTKGTGLGLNIVTRFCSQSGGTLTWQNLEPKGCRFTLMIPGAIHAADTHHRG